MAVNEFNIHRVAFGNVTMPANTANQSSLTLSANVVGAFLPKGAIVTGINFFPAGAVTMTGFEEGTINLACGAQLIGTNDRVASQLILAGKANTMAVVAGSAYVSVGGQVVAHFASSQAARSGIVFDADVYIDYIYCADRDVA